MHKLLLAARFVGAALLCHCLLAGCGSREKEKVSVAAGQRPTTNAQTATNPKPNDAQQLSPPPGAKLSEPAELKTSIDSQPPVESKPSAEDAPGSSTDNGGKQGEAGQAIAEAAWSTQRLALLAPGGPRVIDLRVNVQGIDLAAGLSEATDWLANELEFDFEKPLSWDALLEKPLVKSGWFGNLVPTDEQRAELLAMYDKDNVGNVDADEFQAFLTRGLSRRDQLRLVQGAAAAPLVRSTSPWGPLDHDEDGQLSEEELSRAADALMHFDFDGDRIITERELRSTTEAMSDAGNMARSAGLLDLDLVLASDAQEPAALERAVIEHFTFADAIPRDAFFDWKDRRWSELDNDADGEISRRELAPLHDMPADAQIEVALPNSLGETEDSSAASVACHAPRERGDSEPMSWMESSRGGRLLLPGCVVLVQLRDDHNWQARRLACQQFSQALDAPQLAAALAGPLELKDGAWDLLRERGPENISRGWRWLISPRHFHLTTTWTAVETPWFELVDANGDRRLTGLELSEFPLVAKRWDRNSSGTLEEEELPLVVSLTVARQDNRLANFSVGGTNMEKGGRSSSPGPSWFAAMDYNSDGELTHAEFLGGDGDFAALDADGDGIIDVREVYTPH